MRADFHDGDGFFLVEIWSFLTNVLSNRKENGAQINKEAAVVFIFTCLCQRATMETE